MASAKQKAAAKRNIKKAAAAARRKRAIAHLPKFHAHSVGKQGAKVARETRSVVSDIIALRRTNRAVALEGCALVFEAEEGAQS